MLLAMHGTQLTRALRGEASLRHTEGSAWGAWGDLAVDDGLMSLLRAHHGLGVLAGDDLVKRLVDLAKVPTGDEGRALSLAARAAAARRRVWALGFWPGNSFCRLLRRADFADRYSWQASGEGHRRLGVGGKAANFIVFTLRASSRPWGCRRGTTGPGSCPAGRKAVPKGNFCVRHATERPGGT